MISVNKTAAFDVPVQMIWAKVRDFNALPKHHPAVEDSYIEDGQDGHQVGCIRRFYLKQGGMFREQLLKLDEKQHLCVYAILESPIPVRNYIATIQLKPLNEGASTLMEWNAQFECDSSQVQEMESWVGNVFEDGFQCLEKMVSSWFVR